MISFQDVHKRYPNGREALAGLSIEIGTGEMAFLTGHSGAGKSTVLKLIALLERPTRGKVVVGGHDTATVRPRGIPLYRRQIGVVFQDNKLLAERPVYDNVALPLAIAGVPRREMDRRVRAALDQVGLLGREANLPIELSAGEQQRVGIARAVIAKPPLLIADEPTGNLDPDLALEVMNLFRRFNDVGVTVVIATHDVHLIDRMGLRRIHIEQGHLAEEPDGRAA
ncbi:MAG: cell division ATP-binding protein FtsE [Steroidobacteraceae bacterium]